jgi:hypothetical protein
MANRGVHFALSPEQEASLLAAVGDDDRVMEIVEGIEEEWSTGFLVESDKAWDAMHRCFCDGKLLYEGGTYPLNHMVCGGRQLLQADDAPATVAYVSPAQVADVAKAAAPISRTDLLARYKKIKQRGYQFRVGEEDFEYVWENFEDVAKFFASAAAAGRAVVFSVDC